MKLFQPPDFKKCVANPLNIFKCVYYGRKTIGLYGILFILILKEKEDAGI